MSDTNAIKWLRAQGVAFEVLTYEFREVGADLAAEAVGKPLEAVCKTLIVKTGARAYWVAIVPGDQRFDTRKMAAAIGANVVDLAPHDEAEKVSGYLIGGISPFAMRRHLPVVIEESLLALDRIVVSGGRRGVQIEIATGKLVELLDARPADICSG
jgi:Cys-tRNA(Pro)/Cys-tRNA(Cys) deacylase